MPPLRTLHAVIFVFLALFLSGCTRKGKEPGTLIYLNGQDIRGLDPHTTGLSWQTHSVFANIYESLAGFDKAHAQVPALAVSWKNVDDLTWEFKIRENVPYHCGGVLDAKDVVFSIERARTHPKSYLRSYLSNVIQVEVLAGNRVRLRTRHPDGFLLPRLRSVFVAPRTFLEEVDNGQPVVRACGTGPYALVRWRPDEAVDLEAFPGYWGPKPTVTKGLFLASSYGEDVARYLVPGSKLTFFLRPTSPSYAKAMAEARPHKALTLSVTMLAFDLRPEAPAAGSSKGTVSGNPLLDPRVREAIARAIDYKKLRDRLGLSDRSAASQFVPPQVFGFDPSIKALEPDAAVARRLLAEAVPGGLSVNLVVRPAMTEFAVPVAEDLKAAGIVVKMVYPEEDSLKSLSEHDSGPTMHLIRHSCRTGDAQEFFERWLHSKVPETGYGRSNVGYDASPLPGLDEEIEEAGKELNPLMRQRLMQKVMREAVASFIAIPLLNDEETLFLPDGVTWDPRADSLRLLAEARVD